MKKALVFFFTVVIGLCFAFTGFAQENTTSGPAKEGKKLTKGRYVKTKKTSGTSTAQQPTQSTTSATAATPAKQTTPSTAATPAKQTTPSSSTAPTKVQNGTVGPGSASGKKLTKGKFTKTKSTSGSPAAQ